MKTERIFGIFAHPDDESILAGGTLAACAAAGVEVVLISVTSGELGLFAGQDLAAGETVGMRRESELREAARALGASEAFSLGRPDGELVWDPPGEIEAELANRIAWWRPQAVITFGPEGLYWHPDHIAVHNFTLKAVESAARGGFAPQVYYATFPIGRMKRLASAMKARGLSTELWGLDPEDFGAPEEEITTVLDVRGFLSQKLRALRCHSSQFADDNLFTNLPAELAQDFLGYEYFMKSGAVDGTDDWLSIVLSRTSSQAAAHTQPYSVQIGGGF